MTNEEFKKEHSYGFTREESYQLQIKCRDEQINTLERNRNLLIGEMHYLNDKIQKMKNCGNCKNRNWDHFKCSPDDTTRYDFREDGCGCDGKYWRIKE